MPVAPLAGFPAPFDLRAGLGAASSTSADALAAARLRPTVWDAALVFPVSAPLSFTVARFAGPAPSDLPCRVLAWPSPSAGTAARRRAALSCLGVASPADRAGRRDAR
ncbi:MAG TPA: hypothetical protein VNK95_02980 [Caldilineaceae bacterium]|nr:hypothetical protein [Caldilineaceae bacterium]